MTATAIASHYVSSGGTGGGASALDDLTDVAAPAPSIYNELGFDGSVWRPRTPPVYDVRWFGAVGDGTTDDRDAIADAVAAAAGGILVFPTPSVAYAWDVSVNAPVLIPSGTRLLFGGSRVRLIRSLNVTSNPIFGNANPNAVESYDGWTDHDITIDGLRIYSETDSTGVLGHGLPTWQGVDAMSGWLNFLGVNRLTLTNINFTDTDGFAIHVARVAECLIARVHCDHHVRDGIHVNGYSRDVWIRDITCTRTDGMIQINAYDWKSYAPSDGPIERVLIENLSGSNDSSPTLLLMPGNATWPGNPGPTDAYLKDITIRGVRNFVIAATILRDPWVGPPTHLATAGRVENLVIDGVRMDSDVTSTDIPIFTAGGYGVDPVTVNGCTLANVHLHDAPGRNVTVLVRMGAGSIVNDLVVRNYHERTGTGCDAPTLIGGTGTINRATFDGGLIDRTGAASVPNSILLTGTINGLTLRGLTFSGNYPAATVGVAAPGDAIYDVLIEGCRFLDGNTGSTRIVHQTAGGTIPRVTVRDTYVETVKALVDLNEETPVDIVLDNVTCAGTLDVVELIPGVATLRATNCRFACRDLWRCFGATCSMTVRTTGCTGTFSQTGYANWSSLDVGQVNRVVYGPDLPYKLSELNPGGGTVDLANDGAAETSFGSGPAVYTFGAWHSLGDIGPMANDVSDVTADLASHAANTANPHAVTAAQVGSYTIAAADARFGLIASANTFTAQNTFAAGTITTSQPFTVTQTWNAGAVTFTGLKVNVTATASSATSLLADVQLAGVSKFQVDKTGSAWVAGTNGNTFGFGTVGSVTHGLQTLTSQPALTVVTGGAAAMGWNSGTGNTTINASYSLGWAASGLSGTFDTALRRAAAGVLQATHDSGTSIDQLDARARNFTTSGLPAAASGNAGRVAFSTDDGPWGKLYLDNGTAQRPVDGDGWDFSFALASDFTVTNGTLSDVTGFSFAVSNGETWEVQIQGASTASDATGDIAAALANTGTWGTAQSSTEALAYNGAGTLTATAATAFASATLSTASPGLTINNGDATVRPFRLLFRFTVTGSGTVKLQIGQAAAAAARTSTLKARTRMMARRIG